MFFPLLFTFPNEVDLIFENVVRLGKAGVLRHRKALNALGEQRVGDAKHAVDLIHIGISPGRFVAVGLQFAIQHHRDASFARGINLQQIPGLFRMSRFCVDHMHVAGVAGALATFRTDR